MARSQIIPIEKIGELIADGAVVTVSSSSGLGCPDAALRAIAAHFQEKGRPRQITTLHPIAAGDMYGIPGIDHLAHPGLLKRVIAGSKTPLYYELSINGKEVPSGSGKRFERRSPAHGTVVGNYAGRILFSVCTGQGDCA